MYLFRHCPPADIYTMNWPDTVPGTDPFSTASRNAAWAVHELVCVPPTVSRALSDVLRAAFLFVMDTEGKRAPAKALVNELVTLLKSDDVTCEQIQSWFANRWLH